MGSHGQGKRYLCERWGSYLPRPVARIRPLFVAIPASRYGPGSSCWPGPDGSPLVAATGDGTGRARVLLSGSP